MLKSVNTCRHLDAMLIEVKEGALHGLQYDDFKYWYTTTGVFFFHLFIQSINNITENLFTKEILHKNKMMQMVFILLLN